ncbi:MAG: Ig-like domain-containing protein, partial [Patescibacteria group bacterium]
GSFSLIQNGGGALNKKEGTYKLSNGTYTWSAVTNSGYVTTGTASGGFSLNAVCPKVNSVTPSVAPESWSLKTKATTAPNINFSYSVKLGTSKDCTTGIAKTMVTMTSTEPTKSIFEFSKDLGVTYIAYPWGGMSLQNGLYYWRIKFESGYTVNQPLHGSFALNKQCGSNTDVVESEVDLSQKRLEYYRALFEKKDYGEVLELTQKDKEDILSRVKKPEQCASEFECRVYCEQKSVVALNLCTKYIHEGVSNSIADILKERTGVRAFTDNDSDGISDYDELSIYRTDPNRADSDKDGFLDGIEVSFRTDPTRVEGSSSVEHKIIAQNNPLVSGVSEPTLLSVKNIVVSKIATNADGRREAKEITFSGHATTNSFVTLYIFSEPIVVTVKTNALGEWTYTLDKELPDGAHQVISAITDNTGRVLAKSEPLPFVKVAEALTFGSIETVIPEEQKIGFFSSYSLYILVGALMAVFVIGFSAIGIMTRRRPKENDIMTL